MKKLLLTIFLSAIGFTNVLLAQKASASVLKAYGYIENPFDYVSQIESENINSGILIDRTWYDSLILNMNGVDKVTSISASQWARLYSYIYSASLDTNIISLDSMGVILHKDDSYKSINYIGVMNFDFQRIKGEALEQDIFIETTDFLLDNGSTPEAYENHTLFGATVMDISVYGDELNFLVSEDFIFTNRDSLSLEKVEVDFEGNGFTPIGINEIFSYDFGHESKYIELAFRFTFKNVFSETEEELYAHCSVLKKGSETVPLPDLPDEEVHSRSSSVPNPHNTIQFGPHIEFYILYSPQNPAKLKLRRPMVISDAFDPGNKRDYFKTYYTPQEWKDMEGTPKEQDARGMYEILNGDPSPWYVGKFSSPNLITQLRNDGYDLVFVNYLDGAGNIYTNATALRNLFNQRLNGWLRDNKTEEIVLLGPSMGGIITRLMMTQMEQAGENHYVKTWISYDSPQAGANIPLGLQHSVNFLTKINSGGFNALKEAKAKFNTALSKINSTAAKQMLIYHYSETTSNGGGNTSMYNGLYNELNQRGFPKFSKNYAVTNGGTQKLIQNEGLKIVDFKIFSYTWVEGFSHRNTTGSYKIFEGSRQGAGNDELLKTENHIGLDNAPGGWNASIYSLNFVDGNKNKKTDDTNIQYTRTTFMPTATAFGVNVNRTTVYNDHTKFTHCNDNSPGTKTKTPFDVIRGIIGENEEHVTVSPSTSTFLFDELRDDFDNTIRPRERSGQTLNQIINGPVSYTVRTNIEFGRKNTNNTIVFGSQADVIVSAGNKIVFLPGFSTLAGAKMVAKIENINHGTVLLSQQVPNTFEASATEISPYLYSKYDYSAEKIDITTIIFEQAEREGQWKADLTFKAYPNPADSKIVIFIDGLKEHSEYKIFSSLGQVVLGGSIEHDGKHQVDVSFLRPGVYYLIFNHAQQIINTKIIKL
jgi:hypothetical protein